MLDQLPSFMEVLLYVCKAQRLNSILSGRTFNFPYLTGEEEVVMADIGPNLARMVINLGDNAEELSKALMPIELGMQMAFKRDHDPNTICMNLEALEYLLRNAPFFGERDVYPEAERLSVLAVLSQVRQLWNIRIMNSNRLTISKVNDTIDNMGKSVRIQDSINSRLILLNEGIVERLESYSEPKLIPVLQDQIDELKQMLLETAKSFKAQLDSRPTLAQIGLIIQSNLNPQPPIAAVPLSVPMDFSTSATSHSSKLDSLQSRVQGDIIGKMAAVSLNTTLSDVSSIRINPSQNNSVDHSFSSIGTKKFKAEPDSPAPRPTTLTKKPTDINASRYQEDDLSD